MKIALAMILAAACLCGCGSNPVWKKQTFAFSPAADPPSANAPTNIVALSRVTVSPLFRSQSFTYRTGDNAYEQDPYAGFLISPERAVDDAIRASMRHGGALGRVAEPGSRLTPDLTVEATVNQLCGDFQKPSQPTGIMEIHFVVYEAHDGFPGRAILDKSYVRESPLQQKTPTALMAAWESDLRQIMENLNSDYAKASSNDSGR